ncbi:MAG: hypothetical protein A2636_05300 [Elusimicrobia bacterium RIFCSPHIGHO2_01_FULL_64_10]|nr:MAG: hypothetical protein A2636_05300 [Elusimicrobia bacterium RIFCSPHIGHO2_01_FULL_64_10]
MPASSFKDFVMDQLRGLDGLNGLPMFGGTGLYSREKFFAIIYRDRLYFKTHAGNRPAYVRLGMKPFSPRPGQTLKSYYEVPAEVLEEPARLRRWARQALEQPKA